MSDHYQTLGLGPEATEREIKKAYFALVRQFPPETHAEDFRRIREAYEVLSNPESRSGYDRARSSGGAEVDPFAEYGPELGSQLRAAAAAMNAGRPAEAVPILDAAQAANPDVVVVRDMLGVALMASDDWNRASQQYLQLTRLEPKNPLFQVRLGHCYRELKLARNALEAYLEARALAPGELQIRFILSDFHVSQKQWKEALAELDEAAKIASSRQERDWEPALRRVGVQLARKQTRLVKRELEALLASLPPEDEARSYLSDRLSSMAARAFALQRPGDGNHLLDVARSLKPARLIGRFPERVTVDVDQLPAATQAWLREQPGRDIVKPLWSRGYTGPLFAGFLGLALLGVWALLLVDALNARSPWDAERWRTTALFAGAGAWVLAWTIGRLALAARHPLGKFTTLHSHYLVQVNLTRVTLWPLINLTRVSTTHQHTYGVYTASAVRMKFGGRTASLSIRGKQVAEDLANAAAELRGRVLDLLNSGLLEADGEVDFIPRPMLAGARAPGAWKRWLKAQRWQLGAAAAAVAGVLPFVPLQARAIEDGEWELAKLKGTVGIGDYLEAHPQGRHAAEAREEVVRALEDAGRRLRSALPGGQAPALEGMLEALARAGTNRVRVEYSTGIWPSTFRVPEGMRMAEVNLPDGSYRERQRRITLELQRRLDRLLAVGAVELRDGMRKRPVESPVVLWLGSMLAYSGAVYSLSSDPGRKYYGLEALLSADLRDGSTQLAHYELRARPERELVRDVEGEMSAEATYSWMAGSATDAVGHQLAEAMKLPE